MSQRWRAFDRKYCIDFNEKTFTKTEREPDLEWVPAWKSKERLINEYHALKFIKTNTSLPVPEPISIECVDGFLALTTRFIDDSVTYDELSPELQAKTDLQKYVEEQVLPQLQALKSNKTGSITGVVIPPQGVFDQFRRTHWAPKVSAIAEFVFCHNDLAQHNFLCHCDTGEILAIIDWESAGFFEAVFEYPHWQSSKWDRKSGTAEVEELIRLLEPTRMDLAPEETLRQETKAEDLFNQRIIKDKLMREEAKAKEQKENQGEAGEIRTEEQIVNEDEPDEVETGIVEAEEIKTGKMMEGEARTSDLNTREHEDLRSQARKGSDA